MPIYEYRCEACSDRFDVLTSFNNREARQVCPRCESTRTKVLVSAFAAFGGSDSTPVSLGGGGGCGPGCCGGSCGSKN